MFKQMSNREFSDWLADEAMRWNVAGCSWRADLIAEALREASQRIKSAAEYQFDVRAAHHRHTRCTPFDPKGDGSFEGPDGAK